MANLPSSLPTKPSDIVDTFPILAAHVANLWDEVIEASKLLGGTSYTNPMSISDADIVIINPLNIGEAFDSFAYLIRKITGEAVWTTIPGVSLASVVASVAALTATNSSILLGTFAARPSPIGLTDGVLYFASDTKFIYIAVSNAWVLLSQQYDPSALVNNALVYYDSASKTLKSIAAPTQANMTLRTYLDSGIIKYKWDTEGIGYLIVQNVTLYRPSTDVFLAYDTIYTACSNATDGDIILIPAGSYVEPTIINIPANVQVVELQPDSVTVTGRFIINSGSTLRIKKLISPYLAASHTYAVKIVATDNTKPTLNVYIKELTATNVTDNTYRISVYDIQCVAGCTVNINGNIVNVVNNNFATQNNIVLDFNATSTNGGNINYYVLDTILKSSNTCYLTLSNSSFASTTIINIITNNISLYSVNAGCIICYDKNNGGLFIVVSELLYCDKVTLAQPIFKDSVIKIHRLWFASQTYGCTFTGCTIVIDSVITTTSWASNASYPYFANNSDVTIGRLYILPSAAGTISAYAIFLNCNVKCSHIDATAVLSDSTTKPALFRVTSGSCYFYQNDYFKNVNTYPDNFYTVDVTGGTAYVGNVDSPIQRVLQYGQSVVLLNSSQFASPAFIAANQLLARSFI